MDIITIFFFHLHTSHVLERGFFARLDTDSTVLYIKYRRRKYSKKRKRVDRISGKNDYLRDFMSADCLYFYLWCSRSDFCWIDFIYKLTVEYLKPSSDDH